MTPIGLREMMTEVGGNKDDVFLDMGSGKGELVIQSARKFGQVALGIELSQSRHDVALNNLAASSSSTADALPVSLVCGDASGIYAQKFYLFHSHLPQLFGVRTFFLTQI